jgi:hypothetical protein
MANKLSGIHRKQHVRVDATMLLLMKQMFEDGVSPKNICETVGISQPSFSVYKARGFAPRGMEIQRAPDHRVVARSLLASEQPGPVTNLGAKPLVRVSGHPVSFWGLRVICGIGRTGGGNHWGNVSKRGAGAEGIIALKSVAITNIALRSGSFTGLAGYRDGTSWTGGGADYVGWAPLGSAPEAFRYLEQYFVLCACPDAMTSLIEHGVNFISPCDGTPSAVISDF